jgi:hypothetical protein
MTWENYESTVKYIYEALGARVGVVVECYGASCRRLGKSGVSHQIDVLTSHSDGIHKYYTNIECRYWDQKINKDIVIKTAYINDDCNFDKSVLVSKQGFTEDAVLTARNANVYLVELTEHNLVISGDILTKFYLNMECSIPELFGTNINIHQKYKGKYDNHPILKQKPYDAFIVKKNKEILSLKDLITEFLCEKLLKEDNSELFSYKISFEEGTKLKSYKIKGSIQIFGIELFGFKRVFTRLDPDYFENKVWLLMKLIFENKTMVVTLNGEIQEPEPRDPIQLYLGQKCTFCMKPRSKQFIIKGNLANKLI